MRIDIFKKGEFLSPTTSTFFYKKFRGYYDHHLQEWLQLKSKEKIYIRKKFTTHVNGAIKQWEFLGAGSFNAVFFCENTVFKIPYTDFETDFPQRAITLWNEINPEPELKASLFQDGWIVPYLRGISPTQEEVSQTIVDIYARTRRIIIDAFVGIDNSHQNTYDNFVKLIVNGQPKIICIDPGLAIRLEKNTAASPVSLNFWNKTQSIYKEKYNCNFRGINDICKTAKALLFIEEFNFELCDINLLKSNPVLLQTLANAYDAVDIDPEVNSDFLLPVEKMHENTALVEESGIQKFSHRHRSYPAFTHLHALKLFCEEDLRVIARHPLLSTLDDSYLNEIHSLLAELRQKELLDYIPLVRSLPDNFQKNHLEKMIALNILPSRFMQKFIVIARRDFRLDFNDIINLIIAIWEETNHDNYKCNEFYDWFFKSTANERAATLVLLQHNIPAFLVKRIVYVESDDINECDIIPSAEFMTMMIENINNILALEALQKNVNDKSFELLIEARIHFLQLKISLEEKFLRFQTQLNNNTFFATLPRNASNFVINFKLHVSRAFDTLDIYSACFAMHHYYCSQMQIHPSVLDYRQFEAWLRATIVELCTATTVSDFKYLFLREIRNMNRVGEDMKKNLISQIESDDCGDWDDLETIFKSCTVADIVKLGSMSENIRRFKGVVPEAAMRMGIL